MDAIQQAIYFNSLTIEDQEALQFTQSRKGGDIDARLVVREQQRAMMRADFQAWHQMHRAAATLGFGSYQMRQVYLSNGMQWMPHR